MRPTSENKKECTGHDRKGAFQFVVSEPQIVAEAKDIFEVAPHDETETMKILTTKDNIISSAQAGDYFRFMKNVGGGGGHGLFVKKFNVVMQMPSPRTTEN